MNMRDITVPGKAAASGDLAARLVAGDSLPPFEATRLTKDGRTLQVSVTATLLLDEAGRGEAIATTERDIVLGEEAQRQLRRTAEELARSNRELQDFVYVASHDLQEPLRAVSGFLSLLEKRSREHLDERAREHIARAIEGAGWMSHLISDLVAVSRVNLTTRAVQSTDVGAALDAALANLDDSLREASVTVTHDQMPRLAADSMELTQLFQNLLGNAVKFRSPDRPCRCHVGAEKRDGQWVFSVRDNGIGIDPRQLDQVFVMFTRLHPRSEYPGTGVGLAICKKIVERHGGRIWVESKVGEGSAFFFTLAPPETPGP